MRASKKRPALRVVGWSDGDPVTALRRVAIRFFWQLDADGAECTCDHGDECPRCECMRVLKATAPKGRKRFWREA